MELNLLLYAYGFRLGSIPLFITCSVPCGVSCKLCYIFKSVVCISMFFCGLTFMYEKGLHCSLRSMLCNDIRNVLVLLCLIVSPQS